MSRRARRDGPHAARSRARKRALQALYQWELTGQEAGDIVRQFTEEQDFSRVDRAYFEGLLRGTVAAITEIDAMIQAHADRALERVDPMEKSVLRLGTRELTHHPEVPFRVVLDECVSLAGEFGTEQSPGYVNAVLDRIAGACRALERAAAR